MYNILNQKSIGVINLAYSFLMASFLLNDNTYIYRKDMSKV